MEKQTVIKIRKIKTEQDYKFVSKAVAENGHQLPYATHALYKDGEVVGAWSLASMPLVLVWHHTEKMKKIDSIYNNETIAALMDEKGYERFFIACDKDSPYYEHMEKFGYKQVWETVMFTKNLKGGV